jgi:hypothetical protein
MKRRQAIGRILLAGGATVAAYSGYQWFELTKKPDLPFLLSRKALLAELAETIIPATDTPGARDAGVVDFMIPILMFCTDSKTLNHFVRGLQDLEAHTLSRYQKDFLHCSVKEKEEVLHYFEEQAQPMNQLWGKVKNKFWGKTFFDMLKDCTVISYCNSETGATQSLRYIPVPGKYLSCIPLEPGQKSWATN